MICGLDLHLFHINALEVVPDFIHVFTNWTMMNEILFWIMSTHSSFEEFSRHTISVVWTVGLVLQRLAPFSWSLLLFLQKRLPTCKLWTKCMSHRQNSAYKLRLLFFLAISKWLTSHATDDRRSFSDLAENNMKRLLLFQG